MVFIAILNYLMNHILSRGNQNTQVKQDAQKQVKDVKDGGGSGEGCGSGFAHLTRNFRSLTSNLRDLSEKIRPDGLLRMLEQMVSLLLRADPGYAESKKYKGIPNVRHDGKVAVITGGDKDIGAHVASYLIKNGFKVIIGGKVDESANRLKRPTVLKPAQKPEPKPESKPDKTLRTLNLDLSSQESVREFAKRVTALEPKVDLLINSADNFETKKIITKDGIEKNFAENYLGHFYLTNLLINNLKKSENGRIINVSSISHYFGSINFNDINHKNFFIPVRAYTQSKLAQVLFTQELAKRLTNTKITAYVVSPEIIRSPNAILKKYRIIREFFDKISNPENGSQTLIYLALDESVKSDSGHYYSDMKKVENLMCNANSDSNAEKLWDVSEYLTKLDDSNKLKSIKAGQGGIASVSEQDSVRR